MFKLYKYKTGQYISSELTCWARTTQHAKKGESDSLRLVDFAIKLVNSVLDLPDRQVIRSSLGNSITEELQSVTILFIKKSFQAS